MQGNKANEEIFAQETRGIGARSFSGVTDISELPSAYKNAAAVRAQIEHYGRAEIVDEVLPYGCIMADHWQANAPWRRKRNARNNARAQEPWPTSPYCRTHKVCCWRAAECPLLRREADALCGPLLGPERTVSMSALRQG